MELIDIELPQLMELMNDHIITFQYMKRNGTVRTARGTKNWKYINFINPQTDDTFIKMERKIVDILMKLKDYKDVYEYAYENNVNYIEEKDDEIYYYFSPKKRLKIQNEHVSNYFDLDKNEMRSFKNDNYMGVVEKIEIKM